MKNILVCVNFNIGEDDSKSIIKAMTKSVTDDRIRVPLLTVTSTGSILMGEVLMMASDNKSLSVYILTEKGFADTIKKVSETNANVYFSLSTDEDPYLLSVCMIMPGVVTPANLGGELYSEKEYAKIIDLVDAECHIVFGRSFVDRMNIRIQSEFKSLDTENKNEKE